MKKHIPNTITCCNLLSGCVATYCAFTCNAKLALLWIIIGAVFDFFDGMAARMLKVSSPIGKELDSLADVVTFGVAPSAIVFSELSAIIPPMGSLPFSSSYIAFSAFLIAAFSALRLAKFNIDTRQTTSFIGLPTPANALFWGSLIVGQGPWLENNPLSMYLILAMIVVSCGLLVCELPMFSLKFKHLRWKDNHIKLYFTFYSAVMLVLFGWINAWWLIIATYIIVSAVLSIVTRTSNKP